MQDIELKHEPAMILRSAELPAQDHLVEAPPLDKGPPQDNDDNEDEIYDNDDYVFSSLHDSTFMSQLQDLHEAGALDNTNITVHDIPVLHDNLLHENVANLDQSLLPDNDLSLNNDSVFTEPNLQQIQPQPNLAEIDVRNILPEGTRRRRHVRFSLPT